MSTPFCALIGHRLKAWREQQGERQETVALSARRWGLPWSANVVALIEAGRRHLTAQEFVLLPAALGDLGGPKSWVELLPDTLSDRIALTPKTETTIEALRQLLASAGTVTEDHRDEFDTPHLRQRQTWREAAREGVKAVSVSDAVSLAGQDEVLEIDRKAARALRTTARQIVAASWRTWNHSLMEERERQLRLAGQELMAPRRAQAIRGTITRKLLDQLKPLVKARRPTKRTQRRR
jgi:hypothetical protein